MIKVKNLFDPVEPDDGTRIWIEPVGLTKDLQEWCEVTHVIGKFAPPRKISIWFENHPDSYDSFRDQYHEALRSSNFLPVIWQMAQAAQMGNFTILHSGDNPHGNAGTAFVELIHELLQTFRPEAK